MEPLTVHTGVVLPMDRSNVDTDAIIPKQYLKSISRTGFGPFAFDDWRYLDPGSLDVDPSTRRENPDFELNNPAYAGASILLARKNFGCGSSREHAVWALQNQGFRVVVAPSFADIFFSNCFKNGVLPIVLPENVVDQLFEEAAPGVDFTIDLPAQTLTTSSGVVHAFEVDPYRKESLIKGLDDIGQTLEHVDDIRAFEERHKASQPWLFQ